MNAPFSAEHLLPQPDLSFGIGGIRFFSPASLTEEQAGYGGGDWNQNWLVLARETVCDDPIFIDRSSAPLPVYTAMHGMGYWAPTPVADSWSQFLAALEFIRPYAKNREHPVGLGENPLSANERLALEAGLSDILGSPLPIFWRFVLAPIEDL